jgi:cytochrome P450
MSVHLAASHSTSVGITASLYYVAKNPSVQRKLLEEINSSEISSPVKFQEALAMPYLTAVIREAIRLYPPFTSPWPRVVSDNGTGGWEILPGVFVPAGADVGVPAYVSNRDTAVFGSDAEEFRPERWLPLDGERAKEMDHMMFTFGFAGSSRVCIGKNLAQMEMCKSVVETVRRYHVGLVDETIRLEDVDLAFVHCIVDGLLVTFTPR